MIVAIIVGGIVAVALVLMLVVVLVLVLLWRSKSKGILYLLGICTMQSNIKFQDSCPFLVTISHSCGSIIDPDIVGSTPSHVFL